MRIGYVLRYSRKHDVREDNIKHKYSTVERRLAFHNVDALVNALVICAYLNNKKLTYTMSSLR